MAKEMYQSSNRYVCISMFTGCPVTTVSMETDSLNWAKGRVLSKECYFLDRTSKPEAGLLVPAKFVHNSCITRDSRVRA